MQNFTPQELPVYRQKQRILDMLETGNALVVESPTGSGKTTQLPVILHEAGYTGNGIIGVTQPRRIAAISVSEFIAAQLHTVMPDLIGYKMRFEDRTGPDTRIKIMTDGILLQEMKLDPWLSKYALIIVDEAHERSLNIDFVLGLLKRILLVRKDFKVIISSATINAGLFSMYFDDCPVVKIDTPVYPVTVIYDPPPVPATENFTAAEEAMLDKIVSVTGRALQNTGGHILTFLPGERSIKNCIERLTAQSWSRKLHILPLYGRLGKEEQERIFDDPPPGKQKMIVSTNIAETSVTINGVTCVIDSGKAKLNFYNPRTYTASLLETPVSKASCNQRKGRAGRTGPGICYRLYDRQDFERRPLYTTEEIYRTDLSEVVLRMAELGIFDFEGFDFISPPSAEGITGAVETLNLLGALNPDRSLSKTGEMMCLFPLLPRLSRMIVEAVLHYPAVLEEVTVAAAFLSVQSPFLLPPGKEMDARRAHLAFRDPQGDFLSFLKIFRRYTAAKRKDRFCKTNFLDERILAEIVNIKQQMESIVSGTGIPLTSGGTVREYLTCIATGMIQFVCVRDRKGSYRTLTTDRIQIHPGSCLYRETPQYIVAGEIVRTSRMYAMTVSPVTPGILEDIRPGLQNMLSGSRKKEQQEAGGGDAGEYTRRGEKPRTEKETGSKDHVPPVVFAGTAFQSEKEKGRRTILFPLKKLEQVAAQVNKETLLSAETKKMRGKILTGNGGILLDGMKLPLIFKAARELNLHPVPQDAWPRKTNFRTAENLAELEQALPWILRVTQAKEGGKTLGFITLYTDGQGTYWLKVSKGFHTAVNESLASLESFIEETSARTVSQQCKETVSTLYGKLNAFFTD